MFVVAFMPVNRGRDRVRIHDRGRRRVPGRGVGWHIATTDTPRAPRWAARVVTALGARTE